jgi:Spy/CpxP family protein refolding chaperone
MALMAVFLTGAAFGAVVMKFSGRAGAQAMAQTAPSWTAKDSRTVLELFKRDLNLTDKQSADMEIVLDDFSMYLQNLQSQLEDVRQDGRQRIMKILTPEQQEKFKKVVAPVLAQGLK